MYRQQDSGAGAEQQYQLSASSGTPSFNQIPFPASVYGLDSRLQGSSASLQRGGARPSSHHQFTPTRPSAADPHTHLPHSMNASPRLSAESSVHGSNAGFKPSDRSLPSRDVTAENMAEIFAEFILYCNPNYPLDVDTATLKSNFKSPPKSDSKDFETFRLFELIRKFDAKEIKTWAQLALDLGVEAPDTAKGQSVQKVQQYSVRLKRWMRAMHIDAFFEYLLGKQHTYFTDIPHPSDPYPMGGRDGVAAEEDLAIRALDPAFRPKRGRRRNSETDPDEKPDIGSASKRARLLEGAPRSAMPLSAAPLSAHPDGFHTAWDAAAALAPGGMAPWAGRPSAVPQSAAATSNPHSLRWQMEHSTDTPNTAYPLSAIPSAIAAQVEGEYDNEPRSAVTPTTRRRRKHGPAVSSAWPSANAPGSKPRGRPPAHRSIQDGPFGTFPADPINDKSGVRVQTPVVGRAEESVPEEHPAAAAAAAAAANDPPMFRAQGDGNGRPGRLSLQVPPRAGAPIRLATPPQVLVNGESNERENLSTTTAAGANSIGPPFPSIFPNIQSMAGSGSWNGGGIAGAGGAGAGGSASGHWRMIGGSPVHVRDREIPGFAFEVLRRVLASDLLRADLVGRRARLTGDEAKRLADAVLDRLGVPRADTDLPRDDIARLTAASWLGVGDQLNVPLGPAIGRGKRITVTRFRTNADGYEEIVNEEEDDDEDESGDDDNNNNHNDRNSGSGEPIAAAAAAAAATKKSNDRNTTTTTTTASTSSGPAPGIIRESFDLLWNASLGSCLGSFEMQSLTLGDAPAPAEDTHDLLLRKALEAPKNIDRDGWIEQGMHDVARSAARDRASMARSGGGGGGGGGRRRPGDENIDWKAKCKAMEFSASMAKGQLDRFKQRVLEQILDAIL